jgi:hypothetical protein
LADVDGNMAINRRIGRTMGKLLLTRFGKQRLYTDSFEVRAECNFMRFGLRGSLVKRLAPRRLIEAQTP